MKMRRLISKQEIDKNMEDYSQLCCTEPPPLKNMGVSEQHVFETFESQPQPFMLLELITWIIFDSMMSIKLAIFLLLCAHNFPLIIQTTSYSVNLPSISFPLIIHLIKLAPTLTSETPCNHL
jgi:hypothetical protein